MMFDSRSRYFTFPHGAPSSEHGGTLKTPSSMKAGSFFSGEIRTTSSLSPRNGMFSTS